MWFRLGCLCQGRHSNYFLRDSFICLPWSSKGKLIQRKSWCVGFRSFDLLISIRESSVSNLEPIGYDKDCEGSSIFPNLDKCFGPNAKFNKIHAEQRSKQKIKPKLDPIQPSYHRVCRKQNKFEIGNLISILMHSFSLLIWYFNYS